MANVRRVEAAVHKHPRRMEEERMVAITVNGVRHRVSDDPSMALLWFLRDRLGLTGTKYGCGIGACGACTVHLDGVATRACVTALGSIEGKHITTIEGLVG